MPATDVRPVNRLTSRSILTALERLERPAQAICYQRRPRRQSSRPFVMLYLETNGRTRIVRVYLETGECRLVREGGLEIAHLDPIQIANIFRRHGCYTF